MPVIGCLEIFQNGLSPQPITGIIYSPGCHELKIGSAAEDTLGFILLVYRLPGGTYRVERVHFVWLRISYVTHVWKSRKKNLFR